MYYLYMMTYLLAKQPVQTNKMSAYKDKRKLHNRYKMLEMYKPVISTTLSTANVVIIVIITSISRQLTKQVSTQW